MDARDDLKWNRTSERANEQTSSTPNHAIGKEVLNDSIDAIQNMTHGGIRSDLILNCGRNEGVQLHPQ